MHFSWISLSLLFVFIQSIKAAIDLSHPFDNNTIYWPGAQQFLLFIGTRGPSGALPWYEGNSFEAAEHGGTHVDAPAHFSQGKWRVDDIPVNRLAGMGAVIDVRSKTRANRDYQITTQDILDWEQVNGEVSAGDIIIFNTGWHQYYENRTAYLGTSTNDAANLHFPGIHPDTARWITDNRSPYAVGLDTPSLDYGRSTDFMTHRILFEANIYGIENVANVNQLTSDQHMIYVNPIKIGDGSGAPARVIAHLVGQSASVVCRASWLLILAAAVF